MIITASNFNNNLLLQNKPLIDRFANNHGLDFDLQNIARIIFSAVFIHI